MTVSGEIFKIKDKVAFIKVKKPSGCEHCENASFCNNRITEIKALNTINAEVGDVVNVDVKETPLTYVSILFTFLVPVAAIFIEYFLYTLSPWCLASLPFLIFGYFLGLKILDKKTSSVAVMSEVTSDVENCPIQTNNRR